MIFERISRSNLALLLLTAAGLFLGLLLSNPLFFIFGSVLGFGIAVHLVWVAVRAGGMGSDVLALISIVATALTGEWLAGSIISVMLATGQALESWAAGQARSKLEALVKRSPRVVQLLHSDGSVVETDVSKVSIGDRFLVRAGEVVAVDARLEADAIFDESALTGEPLPRTRLTGDEVPSGVVNAGSSVAMVATTTAESSTYAALVRLVQQAKASSAPGVRMANRWAIWFVPLSLGLALAAWLVSGDVEPAIAVLVAATPCPLILAIPIAIISGISRAAVNGAIIKDGAALEALASSQVLLVDKTGTLTLGGPEVTNIQAAPGILANDILRMAATLEQSSAHVLAKAIVRGAQAKSISLGEPIEVTEVLGEGLFGVFEGRRIRVGRLAEPAPDWVTLSTSLQICVDVDDQVIGVIDLNDPIRHDAASTVCRLRGLGIRRVLLVTGDRKAAGEEVGREVGVDEVFAECRPEHKLEIVELEKAKAAGSVLVVGDGINDSPALAAADVGVAMGARGATAASETADVVIIEDSISRLGDAIEISKGARNRALQAAALGMGLSVVAMVSGAFALTTVTQNALIQEFIDALAIMWALVPTKLTKQKR